MPVSDIRCIMGHMEQLRIPKDRTNDYSKEIIARRLSFFKARTGGDFSPLGHHTCDPEEFKGNIESLIGFVQVPVGAIGPLRINGEHASGDFYVPMSTLEGALISSYNRGATVITMSGGAQVVTLQDTIQRAPYFVLKDIKKAKEFIVWFRKNLPVFRNIVKSTTRYGRLKDFKPFLVGKSVYIRLEFTSGDAMGMNMITKASSEICKYITGNFEVERCVIESNMAVDKKPSYINMILGRGKSVSAEVLVPEKIVNRFFMTTAREIADNYRGQMIGNTLSGTMGCTYHFANGIAALYLACGQDLANVSESSVGVINMEAADKDLYVSIYLPSLVLGTVGGGTALPTQKACLDMIGCAGKDKAKKLAEITAATLLSGEISLAAAITAGDFVTAHERYGRNRPRG
jgi:hydroxymethylglutaryl-CoA reductase (NADPH)